MPEESNTSLKGDLSPQQAAQNMRGDLDNMVEQGTG